MGLLSKAVGGTVAAALVVAGGYAWADIHDLVPGVLTDSPQQPEPRPFPTINVEPAGATTASLLTALPEDAPTPTQSSVESLIKSLAKSEDTIGSRVAVVVSDPLTGDTIASTRADTAVVGASVQKLLTAIVALDELGADRTLKTRVVLSGESTLYLAGEGDMMLAAESGDVTQVNGHAGLGDLADQVANKLKLAGVDTITLKIDDSAFTGSATGPWDNDMASLGFAAPVSVVAVDVGRKKDGEYAPRYDKPALAAGEIFAERLKERGVNVSGNPQLGIYESDGAALRAEGDNVLGEVTSAPMAQIVQYFLATSDNAITEVVGRTIARDRGLPGSFSGATTAVVQGLEKLGLDTNGVSLVDCSGLGDTSTLTAELINQILMMIVSPEHPEFHVAAFGLPVASLNGTLDERFYDRNGRGLVRAKTGSLPGVTSLAGTVVTLDNRMLTFVVIADKGHKGGQWGARKTIDAFVEKLAECGCS
ncbi:D-alanyl-D-alanine carboxypeptidase/D-alanyl-D-alanine endopeptidase [Timonella sp. A28]|uniref:D-alanyl-D-alanine carboxypeptidase/D-alanyl-D-alanine endopeptidase n=1 Tax=Timonella sp. A28 TaxID=3442640 RepID=UPI003EBC52E5